MHTWRFRHRIFSVVHVSLNLNATGCETNTRFNNGANLLGYWQKHPKKDLELVLMEFDQNGWKIIDPPKYYKMRCPCGFHTRTLHISPKLPDHGKQALRYMKRQPCYIGKETR